MKDHRPFSHYVRDRPEARAHDERCARCGSWLSPGESADLQALENEGATYRKALAEVHGRVCPKHDETGEPVGTDPA